MARQVRNSSARDAASRSPGGGSSKSLANYVLAFALGGVLTALGFLLLGGEPSTGVSVRSAPRGDRDLEARLAAGRQRQPARPQDSRRPEAAEGQPGLDPVSEAQRINEINRRNMERAMRPPVPSPPRPPGVRTGAGRPGGPGVPAAPWPPGVPTPPGAPQGPEP